jgi:hypothetical protein
MMKPKPGETTESPAIEAQGKAILAALATRSREAQAHGAGRRELGELEAQPARGELVDERRLSSLRGHLVDSPTLEALQSERAALDARLRALRQAHQKALQPLLCHDANLTRRAELAA